MERSTSMRTKQAPPQAPRPSPPHSSTAACPICLEELLSGSVSLGCGHLLHADCLAPTLRDCPQCRKAIDHARVKPAAAVPGAAASGGGLGYRGYAQRSAMLSPSPPLLPRQRCRHSLALSPAQAASLGWPLERPPSRAERDELLASIAAQMSSIAAQVGGTSSGSGGGSEAVGGQEGQGGPHMQASPAAAAAPGSAWAYVVDASGSMGSIHAWHPACCSRLAYALATLACTVEAHVPPGDWVYVAAFSDKLAPLKPWFRKPVPFDKSQFVEELSSALLASGAYSGGTRLCHAVQEAVATLARQARSLEGEGEGEGEGEASQGGDEQRRGQPPVAPGPAVVEAQQAQQAEPRGEAPAPQAEPAPRTYSLVLLTDGEATDPEAFHLAHAAIADPPFPQGGFRALLMHIDASGSNPTGLRSLARRRRGGGQLEHVQLLEMQLPEQLDLTPLPSSRGGGGAGAGAPTSREWEAVRSTSTTFSSFCSASATPRPSWH